MPKTSTRAGILLAASLFTVQGCTTMSARIGPDDGTDVCRRELVALDSTGDYFAQDIVAGAALGAVGGGLIGALAGGNLRSAAFGALAGGAAGALGGYFKARQQQYADQASLYQAMSTDMRRDSDTIDRTQAAFDQLVNCRSAEAGRIRFDLRAGRVTRAQAQAAMDVVRQRADADLRIAQSISAKIGGRTADFEFANAQINPGYARPVAGAPPPRRPARPAGGQYAAPAEPSAAEVQAATFTNVAKNDRFRASVTAASANRAAFELS